MRFALLGDHPDGLDMARALVASGRHELAAYTGQPAGAESLGRWGLAPRVIRDVEEILADPTIEAILVASPLTDRPTHVRRSLQSEHHVLCVHPIDQTPDTAYEAALLQGDTGRVLLPLLAEALHPAFTRLAEFVQAQKDYSFLYLHMERDSADALVIEHQTPGQKPSLRGWDVLRTLGGEVAEVFALSSGEQLDAEGLLVLSGRFERRGLFQVTLLPSQSLAHWHVAVVGSRGRAELAFPEGWPGPCSSIWQDKAGEAREEQWETWSPWPALVELFEQTVARLPSRSGVSANSPTPLTWQTAVRSLELDDAVRRSIERRRVSTLEYPEATDEVGFKGTMTLVGCALLWVSLLLFILSAWVSWLKWAIVPLLIVFLGLQLLRWIVPSSREHDEEGMRESR